MKKTIKFTDDGWATGRSIDFAKSTIVPAPTSFGVASVSEMSIFDPLKVTSTPSYTHDDIEYTGRVALIREGTSVLNNGFYKASYTESVNYAETMIKSIISQSFAEVTGYSITFSRSVSYNSIAGKKFGQLLEDGDTVIGTAFKDTLKMTGRAEVVTAGLGNDVVEGRGGNDNLKGAGGNDRLDGGTGDDKLYGGAGDDALVGGAGRDQLLGGAGKDTLYGGVDRDALYGGKGSDTFVFKSASDLVTAKTKTDTIFDFSRTERDLIDIKSIDALSTKSGNQAFSFIGTEKFSKSAGELRYSKEKADTYVYGDINGDGKADFAIHIDSIVNLKAGDFIL